MAHIIRTVASGAALVINRSSCGTIRTVLSIHVRTIFSSSGIGLDNFKLSREQHVSRHAPSIDGFKKRFLESVTRSDSQIFTEDLRNMIMSASSDEEIDVVIQALKKYNSNKLKFTDYHFGSPLMRLLYVQNKPDLAMKLFMDESLKDIFKESGSALILMNKLIEDKRYDDAIQVFDYGSQRGFTTMSGRAYPTDLIMLTIEAFYRQNTKESLAKAKELLSKVTERDSDINPRTAAMTALLAVQQGEPSFAMEILGAVRGRNLTTIQNIRAICYAEMGRVEEAINVVHLLADQPPIDNDRRRIFPLVLQHIQKAVEKSKDQDLQTRFADLSKFVTTNDRLSATDLSDFIDEPIHRRGAVVPGRQGTQQFSSGGFQRSGGNFRDSGSNQRSDYLRQGTGRDGYKPDNRFQSGQSRNDNYGGYERSSQNTFNQNDRSFNRNRPSPSNEYSQQDNRPEQSAQSSPRFNRNDSNFPSRGPGRANEQSSSGSSTRRSENKPGVMQTTSTSPIPQRATKSSRTNEDDTGSSATFRRDNTQQTRRNLDSDNNEDSSYRKKEERQSGGNTGIQEQSPWDQGDRKSS